MIFRDHLKVRLAVLAAGFFYWGSLFWLISIPKEQEGRQLFPLLALLILGLSAAALSMVLAGRINRNELFWALAGLFLPGFSCPILAFVRRAALPHQARAAFKASVSGRAAGKSCSNCGCPVPLTARAGERCPHCGACWIFERG